jgi:hypothetical protein
MPVDFKPLSDLDHYTLLEPYHAENYEVDAGKSLVIGRDVSDDNICADGT